MRENGTRMQPRRLPDLQLLRVPTGGVLRSADGTEVASLNQTALALWEQCDGHTSVEEMVEAVCLLFALDRETAARDVTTALARMRDAGVVA